MASPLGLIPPPSQKDRPVGLLLLDTGIPVGVPYLFYPRPEDLQYTHPTRGTVIQTMDGGFVDDFGEGLVDIIVTGNTGWQGTLLPGEVKFQILRELVVIQYHNLRKLHADRGQPIDKVKLYWIDTLNVVMYEIYPVSFTARKNRQRPLLFQYTLRMTGINRLFSIGDAVTGLIGRLTG